MSITGKDHENAFTMLCTTGNYECLGRGLSKKEARQTAALDMMKLINSYGNVGNLTSDSSFSSTDTLPSWQELEPSYNAAEFQNKDAVGALTTICLQNSLKIAEYEYEIFVKCFSFPVQLLLIIFFFGFPLQKI